MKKLNNWAVIVKGDSYTPPELTTMHFTGEREDGKTVTTSAIVGRIGDHFLTHSGSKYSLGDAHPDYESAYPDALNRLITSIPEQTCPSN